MPCRASASLGPRNRNRPSTGSGLGHSNPRPERSRRPMAENEKRLSGHLTKQPPISYLGLAKLGLCVTSVIAATACALVFSAAVAKDEPEDGTKEDQAQGKADSFAEVL